MSAPSRPPRATVRTHSEKRIQAEGEALLRLAGCQVYHLSQSRASHQTPGLPDTFAFGAGRAFWVEWKTPRGTQSPAQVAFQRQCEASGLAYVLGGLDMLREWLIAIGLARRNNGQFLLTPQHRRTA